MSDSITMETCPKYQSCNAPVCPLDPKWRKRKHINGDKACLYLLESAKTDSKAIFEGAGLGELYAEVVRQAPEMIASYSALEYAYERAKQSGSRLVRKFEAKHAE